MKQAFAILVVIVAVVSYGVVEGRWSNRWGVSDDLEKAAGKISKIPKKFGGWQGTIVPLEERVVMRAEIENYFSCSYTNEATGEKITALVICGKPGPTCAHTPEICYPGVGFQPIEVPRQTTLRIDGFPHEATFRTARFRKTTASVPQDLEIYWSWNTDGNWKTPDWPMWTFASSPALYKMYVIRELTPIPPEDGQEPTQAFLKEFVPEVHKCLFSKEP